MIVTDLGEAGLEDMDDMVAEGVASFKLFMAYPGVLMVDDADDFSSPQPHCEEWRAHLPARRKRRHHRRDRETRHLRRKDGADLSRR